MRFMRRLAAFTRNEDGPRRRDDERYENMPLEVDGAAALLVAHGLQATVGSLLRAGQLPVDLRTLVAQGSSGTIIVSGRASGRAGQAPMALPGKLGCSRLRLPAMPTTSPALASLQSRESLSAQYGDNALLLLALEMRFGIDDILTEAASCITDGSNDRKCDAVYIDRETSTAVVAQAYRSESERPAAPSNKAADLNTAASWIFSLDYTNMNESLRAAAQELDDAIRREEVKRIEFWYCHNLAASENVTAEMDRAVATAASLARSTYPELELEISGLEVGRERLDDWYSSVQNPILVADRISVEIDGYFEEVGADWTAVCASIPAKWLTELHGRYGDKLFSANVRGYMPSRRTAQNINFNIEDTARQKPGRFWAYNNGVTALVHDYLTPQSANRRGTLELTGIAIVNGAQTTGALSRSGSAGLDDVSVLARFIRSDNDEIIDEVIRYNNSQNPIKPSDFRSTDRHQERLRRQFAAIPDAVYFGARRGGEQDRARRPSNLVPSETVAQCLASFHGQPGVAYHELRSIWESDQIYSRFFSENTTAVHIVFAYSLLLAIQRAKADFVQREARGELAEDERETLAVFRQRGSQFMLVAAFASCIEIILGRPVANRFSLSFGSDMSPAQGSELWGRVVDVMLPFVHVLRADELKGSLRNEARVEEAIGNFRAIVRSTARANQEVFSGFASHVQGA